MALSSPRTLEHVLTPIRRCTTSGHCRVTVASSTRRATVARRASLPDPPGAIRRVLTPARPLQLPDRDRRRPCHQGCVPSLLGPFCDVELGVEGDDGLTPSSRSQAGTRASRSSRSARRPSSSARPTTPTASAASRPSSRPTRPSSSVRPLPSRSPSSFVAADLLPAPAEVELLKIN